ncbi:hypothetical protein MO867_03960 [Microbulbifer sp. OS29]|uniref:Uncharacterized protein n=1 Tax=Microbulbifer okhotskensis TaxID=2926617 RepID=A0A9X2EKU6_9GAMM|nr:hypothetical protein [Microbulbifer okhotskensis]MCO1333489.1 hypothetical protein [Microbulbifer okhotskensis]
MENWQSLILIRDIEKKYKNLDFKLLLESIMKLETPIYYLVPPGRFVDHYRHYLDNQISITVHVPDPADNELYTGRLIIWGGSENTEEGADAFALNEETACLFAESALYNFVTKSRDSVYSTQRNCWELTLLDDYGKPLIIGYEPTSPNEKIIWNEISQAVAKQHPKINPNQTWLQQPAEEVSFGQLAVHPNDLIQFQPLKSKAQKALPQEGAIEVLGPTERRSLINIIWALKELSITKSRNANQSTIITELVDKYGGLRGISKAKLGEVLGEANKQNKHRVSVVDAS